MTASGAEEQDACGEGIAITQLFENLSHELTVALGICVNLEEIIADRLLLGGTDSNFVRVELQNIDRLIQMLTDFRSLSSVLSTEVHPQQLPGEALRRSMLMEETATRILSPGKTRRVEAKPGSSDVTFF